MAAHKFWQARLMAAPTPGTVELSEFHLYDGATRVDASATLTASASPTGAVANLKDDNTATGSYWSTGGDAVVLTWAFATATNVDGIVVGARTTASRFPLSLILMGGDTTPESGSDPVYREMLSFGGWRFVSATKTALQVPNTPMLTGIDKSTLFDQYTPGGIGRVPYEVLQEVLPRTDPRTYTPQWAKVRLERDIDGKVIREEWNDPVTGTGAFENVDENFTYTLTAIYPESGMRAVIADRIKPEGYPEPEAP